MSELFGVPKFDGWIERGVNNRSRHLYSFGRDRWHKHGWRGRATALDGLLVAHPGASAYLVNPSRERHP